MDKTPNAALGRLSAEEFKSTSKNNILIILDNVRSLLNVGSIFRTADAFLIEGIYLCGITGIPPQKEINKTALGATETVDWEYFSSTTLGIEKAKKLGFQIWSVEQVKGSTMLDKLKVENHQKIALVFGNEVDGIDQSIIDASDGCIEVPQGGTKHSLNIAVCAGIVVWHLLMKAEKTNFLR